MYMKKLELKPIIISISLVVFQSILYALSKVINGSNATLIGSHIDSLIPFNTLAIVPYCIWYFLIFIIPYYYYKKDKELISKYIVSYVLITIIANIIFIVCPTTVNRPTVSGNDIFSIMAKIVFFVDNEPLNCFPSLHCAISFLWIIYTLSMKNSNRYFKLFITIISILIIISTLFIKQHVFIDMIGGICITSLVVIIINHSNYLINKTKSVLKL